jgi:hypothetical protein
LLDIIILVPYNLFRLFLVHKISIYIHIYKKMEKKRTKEKDKEFSVSWARGGGGNLAQQGHTRAVARVGGPLGPPAGERRGDGAVGVGPRARGRGRR